MGSVRTSILGTPRPLPPHRRAHPTYTLIWDDPQIEHRAQPTVHLTLPMALVTRVRMEPRTRAYVERRTAEGRTLREIRRCLKRYLARQIYRQLNAAAMRDQAPP